MQIEKFIETLFPRQDPKKLSLEKRQRENKEPTMDPGETVVLFGVVILALICISGLMVCSHFSLHVTYTFPLANPFKLGTAWFFGARFSDVFREASVFLPGNAKSTPLITGHDEL